ncbi:MAG: hypothetical protein VXV96_16515 [Bdellovibrionota bacterium]|jgi:hypothetical protein|nr:hypothetical protein [Bdellovibrionota bacterium]
MITDHWLSWTILFGFLAFLAYTLIVVKEEKASFKESAKECSFHQFRFQVPSWWGLVEESENLLKWKRTDTRYDWEATLKRETTLNKDISIEEDFKNRIEELELVFDLDSSDILMPADFKDRPEVREGDLEIVRIEGTATQQGTERCYFDAFLFRDHKRGEVLFASSHSSVLNGLVEGPYFEEMILGAHFS